jgi:hypothetical protein
VPTIKGTNPSTTGDLLLTITGGVAGQKIQANVTVSLAQNIGTTTAADTAVWQDSAGNSAQGIKGVNTYTFTNVTIPQPGTGQSLDVKIANMKINGAQAGGAAGGLVDVSAVVAITGPTPIALTGVPAIVARVQPG